MDNGKQINVKTIPEIRKAVKTEMPGLSSIALLESANGFIVVEGSKKYPTGETLAWVSKTK